MAGFIRKHVSSSLLTTLQGELTSTNSAEILDMKSKVDQLSKDHAMGNR